MTATATLNLPGSSTRRRLLAPISSPTGKVQAVGLGILGTLVCMAVLAPLLSPYGPSDPVCEPFLSPESGHPLGCNDAGQDLWSQLLYGTRVSLSVGVIVAGLSTVIATFLALVAGYSAGAVQNRTGRQSDNLNQTYTVDTGATDSAGQWQLRVIDGRRRQRGTLDSWRITFP